MERSMDESRERGSETDMKMDMETDMETLNLELENCRCLSVGKNNSLK